MTQDDPQPTPMTAAVIAAAGAQLQNAFNVAKLVAAGDHEYEDQIRGEIFRRTRAELVALGFTVAEATVVLEKMIKAANDATRLIERPAEGRA